ncbi:MAG: M48 family metalloprotease [Fimbriimonadia bacterium]|jgi:predicted Zn-dependent protease
MRTRIVLWLLLATNFLATTVVGQEGQAATPPSDPALSDQDKQEVEMGKKGLAEVQASGKLGKDEAILARIRTIGNALAEIAKRKELQPTYGYGRRAPFDYQFFYIEDKDVNAFAMPGGFIFVHSGLLDFVESDDELAAVLAHEIIHAAHHHLRKVGEDQAKVNRDSMLAALAAALATGGGSENTYNIITGTMLYQVARTNRYILKAELDADIGAYALLRESPYNPVGMLTMMERLYWKNAMQPALDWGIFQTHPPTAERASNVLHMLAQDRVPVRRSAVSSSNRAVAKLVTEGDTKFQEVTLGDLRIVRLVADPEPADPLSRANGMLPALNLLLDSELELYEVSAPAPGRIAARGVTLVEFGEDDARANGQTMAEMTKQVREQVRRVVNLLTRIRSLSSQPFRLD